MTPRAHTYLQIAGVVVLAMLALSWFGMWRTLDPHSTFWMYHEDPITHVLGWESYRDSPMIQYPLLANTRYGLEGGSSAVFSDSIPIAALLLRPLSGVLPHPFQYLGWWAFISLALQAYWGARLVALRVATPVAIWFGAAFFIANSVALERVGFQTALATHWVLLAALWLYLAGRRAACLGWSALLWFTVSVHAYLFVLVGAIWAAAVVRDIAQQSVTRRDAMWCAGTIVAVIAWMHAIGYFMVHGGDSGARWRSQFDLLALIQASYGAHGLGLHAQYPHWDGSAYFGLGLLALGLFAVTGAIWRRRVMPTEDGSRAPVVWWPLVSVIVACALFSITNRIVVAGHAVFTIPVPARIEGVYSAFRGAIRMIWPAYYLLITIVLWSTARRLGRWTALVWGIALVVQVVDIDGVVAGKRHDVASAPMIRPLKDPVWGVIADHYDAIVSVPFKYRQADWWTLAWFATSHHLATNAAYLSRSETRAIEAAARARLDQLARGTLARDTVYYLPSEMLWQAARAHLGADDLALIADGFPLIVPGGRKWFPAEPAAPPADLPEPGQWISFGCPAGYGLLSNGWSWREAWGTWAVEGTSSLVLPAWPDTRVRVTLRLQVPADGPHKPRRIRLHLGEDVFDLNVSVPNVEWRGTFETTTKSAFLEVAFEDRGRDRWGPNQRALRVGLIAARVERASDPVQEDIPAAAKGLPFTEEWVPVNAGGRGLAYLVGGWSWPEPWGTWTAQAEAVLVLPVPPHDRIEVSARWIATAPPGGRQSMHVHLDNADFPVKFPATGTDQVDSFVVTTGDTGWLVMRLDIAELAEAGGRWLGVGLKDVRTRRAN